VEGERALLKRQEVVDTSRKERDSQSRKKKESPKKQRGIGDNFMKKQSNRSAVTENPKGAKSWIEKGRALSRLYGGHGHMLIEWKT